MDVISQAEFDSMRVSDEPEEDGELMFGPLDQEDAPVAGGSSGRRSESGVVRDSRPRGRDGEDRRAEKSSPSPSTKRRHQRRRRRREERQERFYPVLKESSSSMVTVLYILTVFLSRVCVCVSIQTSKRQSTVPILLLRDM